ncbi:MAG: hypothetical protein MZV64_44895 [Ignavibacteriales bacterium]|nr:hypothetical protein [Ignavibacteriales bacterium]
MRGFTEALRRELADTNVSVRYVAPRATRTGINTSAVERMNDGAGRGDGSAGAGREGGLRHAGRQQRRGRARLARETVRARERPAAARRRRRAAQAAAGHPPLCRRVAAAAAKP